CKASESLRPLAEGVRINVRAGKRVVADGPFAEAKEMVGGFFMLDCRTKAEAVAIAAQCPATEWATVEALDRPHLDRTDARRRHARGDADRLVEVAGFDQVVAHQLLPAVGEGAVGHQPLPAAEPDGGRGGRRLERVGGAEGAALHQA